MTHKLKVNIKQIPELCHLNLGGILLTSMLYAHMLPLYAVT